MKNDARDSNIDLLKVIAIFMIVLCHTGISMTYAASGHADAEWFYDINALPNTLEKFALTFFNYCGYLGNDIFFVCSAWFLLGKKQNRKIKILKLELDVWLISVLYLVIFLVSGVHMNGSTMLRAVTPTTFDNNWFVTAYMLFYFIYPWLNQGIERIPRNHLKYGCLFFAFLICIWVPFFQQWAEFKFYFSYPMMWVLVYFCIAYLKTYHMDLLNSRKFAVTLFLVGFLGLIGEMAATYFFGSYTFLIGGSGMRWNMWWNPFEWFFAFGAFNIFRTFHFRSRFINRISSLSLLIYLIHENFLVREHWRPHLYMLIHNRFHNQHVALWFLLAAFLTFVVSAVLAYFYQQTLQKVVYRIADRFEERIRRKLGT